MKRSIRKTWNIISTVLVALVVLLALLLVGARLFGLQVFTVLSGSMEPTYHTGSLIYVKKVDPYTIQSGTMTGDLACLCGKTGVTSVAFLDAVRATLESSLL